MNDSDVEVVKSELQHNTKMTTEIHGAIFGTNSSKGLREIVATHSLALKIIGLATLSLLGVVGAAVANHLLK